MLIREIIERVRTTPNCTVVPPSGLPAIEEGLTLPEDVREFYQLCGGVYLHQSKDYQVNIAPPDHFILANPVLVGERCEDDISSDWYIVAHDGGGEYLTIDLHPDRKGKCYDSFFDRHGIVGETQVIAISFTQLLQRLLENRGEYWYWLRDDFESLGDAYDGV